jgi:DNA-binding transcriptional ArsR family regulator
MFGFGKKTLVLTDKEMVKEPAKERFTEKGWGGGIVRPEDVKILANENKKAVKKALSGGKRLKELPFDMPGIRKFLSSAIRETKNGNIKAEELSAIGVAVMAYLKTFSVEESIVADYKPDFGTLKKVGKMSDEHKKPLTQGELFDKRMSNGMGKKLRKMYECVHKNQGRKVTLKELAKERGISAATVSKHLRMLIDAERVSVRQVHDGNVYHCINSL